VLIDTGAGINEYVKEFLHLSDDIIAITTTDPSALTDVYAMIKMVYEFHHKISLIFNQTKTYQIGQTITNSLIKLASKNNIPNSFQINYLGNISQNLQIATTSRLRKLFYEEFPYEIFSYELEKISQKILDGLV